MANAIRNEHIEQRKTNHTRTLRNRVIGIIITAAVLLAMVVGAGLTYRWTQTKYYIGDDNGRVSIFQGVPTSLFGFQLSHAVSSTDMKTDDLPESWQEQLVQGISFDSYDEAKSHTDVIKKQLDKQAEESKSGESGKTTDGSDSKSQDSADTSPKSDATGGDAS